MLTKKVLLAGGRAAGRIVEVDIDATETTVQVIPLPITAPDSPVIPAPASATQTYIPTDQVSSGYEVWRLAP